ncbi:hypothetical protein [Gordonia terrae]|uniref:hypothetical protein n=1 Tax=Gordonia terrae TaxID=2055 RepID=UPI003F6B78F4
MRLRLRQPSAGLAALLALGLGVSIVAVVLIAAVVTNSIESPRFDYGNVPAWLTFAASGVTLLGVVAAWRSLKANLANRQDDEASIARLLVNRWEATPANGRITVTITLRNASPLPFHQIEVLGVAYGELGCQQHAPRRLRERKAPERMYLPPNEQFVSVWVVPDPRIPWDAWNDTRRVTVFYRYLDGNGRRWRRLDDTEPKRVLPPSQSHRHLTAFEDSMRARIPDGASVVDADYWREVLGKDAAKQVPPDET